MDIQLQTVIFLCRHGETDKPYSIDPNIDAERVLSEHGKKQIAAVGEYLRVFSPSAIYSSPRKRTIQTAEIIRKNAEISSEAIIRNELIEIYSDADYEALSTSIPSMLSELVDAHRGEHIVCTSHQDVIEGGLRALGVQADEAEFPCKVGECYRVVFAGDTFVQATKLIPAKDI